VSLFVGDIPQREVFLVSERHHFAQRKEHFPMKEPSCLLAQILRLLPHNKFDLIVAAHKGEKFAKGFTCYAQLVAMLYLHLSQARGLGEACDGLQLAGPKLRHLGLDKAPPRSSVAYANDHRPAAIYAQLYQTTAQQALIASPGGKQPFRCKRRIITLDSTTILLCATLFPWAAYQTQRRAVKIHLELDHQGNVPIFAVITDGKKGDVTLARALSFPKGSILVIDRGYNDYALYARWTQQGVYFLTRQKGNVKYVVESARAVPPNSNILADEIIRLSSDYAHERCTRRLRRIVVRDTKGNVIVLLTNHLKLSATTLAEIYRNRWQIEVFFRHIKQQLRIKAFVGHSPNAVAVQIWTALLAWTLLEIMKFQSTFGWTWCRLCAMLRRDLFTCRLLHDWLNNPFQTGPPGLQAPGP
jgi:hypothetical protein